MREIVKITEIFTLPFQISLNYKSNLVSVGPNSYARIYGKIWYSYQGVDRYIDVQINLDFQSAWKSETVSISYLETIVIGYDLYIEINDLQGNLFVDNIKATHGGQNWCRDTFCKDIHEDFTKAFYQIPKNWAGVDVPDGAWFESTYQDF
jgi:hypothetical protein